MRIWLYYILFLISFDSVAQELFVFEPINNNFSVAHGANVGSYTRVGQQMLFEDKNNNTFECVRLGKVINFNSSNDIGTYKAVGLHSIIFESNHQIIYFNKEGDHYIITEGKFSAVVSRMGNSFLVEANQSIDQEVIYKFGIILVYHLLDGV